jgi:cobalt-zinc-cadmium efflux system outer membrane protein
MKVTEGVFMFTSERRTPAVFALLAAAALAGTPGPAQAGNENSALRAWVAQLLQEHPRVLAVQANADAAQAQGRAAQAPLHNPELELDAARVATNSFSVGVNQTLDWSGKRASRAALADQHLQAALAELDGTRQALAAEALAALARYHGARGAVTLAEKRLELLQRFMQVAVRRFEAGDIGRADADLARLAFSQARIRQAHARTALLDAEQGMHALHGQAPPAWPALDVALPTLVVPQDAELEQLLLRTPELRAAQARMEAARGNIELAERERHADPIVGVRGGRDGSDTLVGLSLTIPLSMRNPRRAEVDAARAQALAAEYERNALYRQARVRLAGDAARYRIVFDAWEEWRRSGGVTLGERTTLLNQVWESGEISASDYLVQLQETLDTETDAAELRGKAWTAWSEWLAGSGQMIAWLGLSNPAQK